MEFKSLPRTPYYIYCLAFLLGVPVGWFAFAIIGDAPGMVRMVVQIIIFGAFAVGLETLRRRLLKNREH